jgi:hypothetical protein
MEAGGLRAPGQPGIHSETLSQNTEEGRKEGREGGREKRKRVW